MRDASELLRDVLRHIPEADRNGMIQGFLDAGKVWYCPECKAYRDPVVRARCHGWVAVPLMSMRPGFQGLAGASESPKEITVLTAPEPRGSMQVRRNSDGHVYTATTPPLRWVRVTAKQHHDNQERLRLVQRLIDHAAAWEASRRAIKESRFTAGPAGGLFARRP